MHYSPKNLLIRLLALALAFVMPLATVSSASAQSSLGDRISSVSQAIWQGLWAGSNGEISSTINRPQPAAASAPARPSTSATPTPATSGNYVALGDSVAAGVGLPGTVQVSADYSRCGRTSQAYPYIVAQQRNLALSHIACSGATAGDLYTKQRSGSPNLPSQLSTAFANGKPSLITITAGANDAHWDYFLRYCYSSDCANGNVAIAANQGCIPDRLSTISTTNLANCYLAAMQLKLIGAFWAIHQYSGGDPPTTIVTGYYNPVSAACTTKYPNVTQAEIAWLNAEFTALNATIRQAAEQYPFVRFVPIDFTGHDICATDPWIQGIGDRQPFHPTTRGQQHIATSVLGAL